MAYSYIISIGPSATGPWTQAATFTTATGTISGLASGTSYFFQIVTTDTVTGINSTPIVAGPFLTTTTVAESTFGTTVSSPSQTIFSGQTPGQAPPTGGPFDTWTITAAGGSVVHNTSTDGNTSNILELYYLNHFVYQEANATNELGINPGWWQFTGGTTGNGFGWTACQDPRPTGLTITLASVPGEGLNTPFGISGLLQNYSTAPTLQYNDNGGTFIALPVGSSVSTKNFSFTHPAVASANASMTVGVRDANNTSVSATSNTFSVSAPTITGITLSGSKNVSSGVAPPQQVGAITVQFSGGSFSGVLSLTGADKDSFTIATGNQLQTAATLDARVYNFSIVATQSGATGSPFTQAESIQAASGPATGPSASSNFVTADFTNKTGQTVSKYVWGVAEGQTGDNGFAGLTDTNLQTILKTLNYPLYRWNSQGTYLEKAFPNGITSTTSSLLGSAFNNLINNFPKFASSDTRLIIGLGFPPTNWSTAADFGNVCGQVATYLHNTNSTVTGAPLNIYGFEFGNENNLDPGVPSWFNSYWTAGASAVSAVNSNWKMCGPTFSFADSLSVFGAVGNQCQVLDYHAYAYGGQSDFDSKGGVDHILNSTLFNNLSGDLTNFVNGGGSNSVEIFLGEFNQNNTFGTQNGGQSPGICNTYMQNNVGAVYNANTILSGLNSTNNFTMAALWATFQNSDYGAVGGADNVNSGTYAPCPGGWFLSKAAATMFGSRAVVTQGSQSNGSITTIAVTGGPTASAFALMMMNGSQTASVSGQIALSHWPVNAVGTGTVNRWEVSSQFPKGNLTSLNVTSGLTNSTSVPAESVVIVYSP